MAEGIGTTNRSGARAARRAEATAGAAHACGTGSPPGAGVSRLGSRQGGRMAEDLKHFAAHFNEYSFLRRLPAIPFEGKEKKDDNLKL